MSLLGEEPSILSVILRESSGRPWAVAQVRMTVRGWQGARIWLNGTPHDSELPWSDLPAGNRESALRNFIEQTHRESMQPGVIDWSTLDAIVESHKRWLSPSLTLTFDEVGGELQGFISDGRTGEPLGIFGGTTGEDFALDLAQQIADLRKTNPDAFDL